MYPQYPQFRPPPPKPGMSGLVIGLLIGGGVLLLGAIGIVVLAVVAVAASSHTSSTQPPPPPPPTVTPTATGPSEHDLLDPSILGPSPGPAPAPVPAPTTVPPKPGTTTYTCNASGSVRVCGFANACNNQMVFGNGVGNDRNSAYTMAKNACENMGRIKSNGTTPVCVVSCSPR